MGFEFQNCRHLNLFKIHAMDKEQQNNQDKNEEKEIEKNKKIEVERKIDEELDQSFPASDPPSYSQPGNDLDSYN